MPGTEIEGRDADELAPLTLAVRRREQLATAVDAEVDRRLREAKLHAVPALIALCISAFSLGTWHLFAAACYLGQAVLWGLMARRDLRR